jgi:hypothetical protein
MINRVYLAFLFLRMVLPVSADTIVLHDGSSYAGQFTGASGGTVTFVDNQGVQYRIPLAEVQSLVCTPAVDVLTLRTGKVYSGHYTGGNPIPFQDNSGIQYQFPMKDVASLVFSRRRVNPGSEYAGDSAKVIPEGSLISIRADETIDSNRSAPGQLYSATVEQDVFDSAGAIAIRAGTPAKLLVRDIGAGGAAHSPDLVLDLFSVRAGGREYRVVTSDVDVSNRQGVGANRRTAEYMAEGSGLGALLGAIVGGGKGAAVGAAAGAGGGLMTQIFTRGKEIKIPVESVLTFRLDRTLVLRPQR